ncbi:MAG: DUF3179 domain-containing protein, partial [Actinobacteria bacterium]|nr:DUF3179 domain-containing protein [Actinomycetota bacterium]
SGKLYFSNLVMYDRQTDTLWVKAQGLAVVGPLTGTQLEFLPAQIVSWADWRAAHPDGKVLSQDTGFDRQYGANPYFDYDDPDIDRRPFLFTGEPDPRLPATSHVLGLNLDGDAVAFPYDALADAATGGGTVVETDVGGRTVVVFWAEGTVSALDEEDIPSSRDVGAATAFDPVLDGRRLSFEAGPAGFVDLETGSRWDILGRAVAGPLRGERLAALPAVDHFWFSWAAFFPDTAIVTP